LTVAKLLARRGKMPGRNTFALGGQPLWRSDWLLIARVSHVP
jgi:hypothetical protein